MVQPAFIVEGHLEQRLVQAICPGKKVVLLGANGDHVEMETICDRIETHVRLFSNRYHPIFVIFDRERRMQSTEVLVTSMRDILSGRGLDTTQFIIFISDRDIEALLLAHVDSEGEFIPTGCPTCTDLDGSFGEGEIKRRLARKRIMYHKTTIGVQYFMKIRPTVVATKSENFRRFRSAIAPICTWVNL
jgi:hypothetical protein